MVHSTTDRNFDFLVVYQEQSLNHGKDRVAADGERAVRPAGLE
jgi:hypothetical protein